MIRKSCSDLPVPTQKQFTFCVKALNSTAFSINGQRKTRKTIISPWKHIELFIQLRKQRKLHTQILSRLFFSSYDGWCNMKSEQFPWQILIMTSKYFFPTSPGERQPGAPHLQASSSSCTPSVRWDFSLNASHEKSPWTNWWWHQYDQNFGEAHRGVMLRHRSFLSLKDSMPSTSRSSPSNTLQQSPVSFLLFKALASVENFVLWQLFLLTDPWLYTEGSAQACLWFNCALLAWWKSDTCFPDHLGETLTAPDTVSVLWQPSL